MDILNLFHTTTIKEVTGIETNISARMYNSIRLWSLMMSGNAPWNSEAPSCGVLEQIANRLATLVSREIGLKVENSAIEKVMYHINSNIDAIVSYITLLGGCLIRPIFVNGKIQYETIPIGNYLPISYDFDGTLTGALILKEIILGSKKWFLTEEHSYTLSTHKVKCQLYKNENETLRKVAMSDCEQTQTLTEEYEWQGVAQPMIIEFRNHSINKIDGSNVPVPIIAGAENLIQDADEQYARMIWEQKGGEKLVFADRDLFQKRQTRDGKETGVKLSPKLNRLIVQVDGDGSPDTKKITEWSPNLRTTQQNEMLQQIFRRIELKCNIGKGTISDAESVQQTATQYTGGRQELFAIVDQIENEIQIKYQHCADVFAHIAAAYKLGTNNSKITVTWNDEQTRKDIITAKTMAISEINAGVKNKWEYRRDFYGEDESNAKANTPVEPVAADPFNFGA
ncbi:phage portal protein [Treponema pectinovorum]|uniref:phage portal protein n=1 Tax=Treponema pectinovorum TaxID=164 RepID=UPI0021C42F2A|nr:phage portal protein [Treponema pectinovorum]